MKKKKKKKTHTHTQIKKRMLQFDSKTTFSQIYVVFIL